MTFLWQLGSKASGCCNQYDCGNNLFRYVTTGKNENKMYFAITDIFIILSALRSM